MNPWLQFLKSILPAADAFLTKNSLTGEALRAFKESRDAIAVAVSTAEKNADAKADDLKLPDLGTFFAALGSHIASVTAIQTNAPGDTATAVEREVALRVSQGILFPKVQHVELCDAARETGRQAGIQEAETRLKAEHEKALAQVRTSEQRKTLCAADGLPVPAEAVLGLPDADFDASRKEALGRVEKLKGAGLSATGEFGRRFVWCSADEAKVLGEAIGTRSGNYGNPLAGGGGSGDSGDTGGSTVPVGQFPI